MKKDKSKSASIPSWIGRHPFPPDKKKSVVITRDMELSTLYGFEGTQVECKRFVSTDKLTLSQWTLPPGTHYEPAGQHNFGDEFYYILKGKLVAIVNRNRLEIDGPTESVMRLEPLREKWKSFGWQVKEIDGHNIDI